MSILENISSPNAIKIVKKDHSIQNIIAKINDKLGRNVISIGTKLIKD